MVEQHSLDAVFHALADGTRRAMLERAGLVRRDIEGRSHRCSLQAAPMHAGAEWLRHYERFWNQRLDALERLLKQDSKKRKRK